MNITEFWSLFIAALGGGFTVKLLEILYQEFKHRRELKSEGSLKVDQRLTPMLRAADELVGKLRSLAEGDFVQIRKTAAEGLQNAKFASVIYLFVQFWSEVEILRFQGFSNSVAKSPKGKQTQAFLRCLESRRVRLIDRISQRALGEAVQVSGRTMNFVEFIKTCDNDQYLESWLQPLLLALSDIEATKSRQRLLQFYVVLHAMIDTLDKDNLVTRDRPSTPNKLNKRSKQDLIYRVFGVYLKFVKNKAKYIGPPK